MNKLLPTLLFVVMAGVVGCRTLPEPPPAAPALPERPALPEMERATGDYAVKFLVLDMMPEAKNLLYANPNLYALQVADAPETERVPLPVFHLKPGETRTLDARASLAYPSAFNEEGVPTAYKTDVIGVAATVSMALDEKRGLVFGLAVEDSAPEWMREHATPSGESYWRPVCRTVSVRTRGVVPTLNEWHVLSGGSVPVERMRQTKDGRIDYSRYNTWRIVLARVTRPKP